MSESGRPNAQTVFVISPIGESGSETRQDADQVLKYIIRKALPAPNYRVVRADESSDSGLITNDIINSIKNADLVVADLTDRNPNVFYELAVAHGFRVPAVHIAAEGTTIPFDVAGKRAIYYRLALPESVFSAIDSLGKAAEHALTGDHATAQNPIEAAGQFAAAVTSGDPEQELLATVLQEIRGLRSFRPSADAESARQDALGLAVRLLYYGQERHDTKLLKLVMSYRPKDRYLADHWRYVIDEVELATRRVEFEADEPKAQWEKELEEAYSQRIRPENGSRTAADRARRSRHGGKGD